MNRHERRAAAAQERNPNSLPKTQYTGKTQSDVSNSMVLAALAVITNEVVKTPLGEGGAR